MYLSLAFWIDRFRYSNIDRFLIVQRGITLLMLVLACVFHQRFEYISHVCICCQLERLLVVSETLQSVDHYLPRVIPCVMAAVCYSAVGTLVVHDLASWP
jgi:hypothetical protein